MYNAATWRAARQATKVPAAGDFDEFSLYVCVLTGAVSGGGSASVIDKGERDGARTGAPHSRRRGVQSRSHLSRVRSGRSVDRSVVSSVGWFSELGWAIVHIATVTLARVISEAPPLPDLGESLDKGRSRTRAYTYTQAYVSVPFRSLSWERRAIRARGDRSHGTGVRVHCRGDYAVSSRFVLVDRKKRERERERERDCRAFCCASWKQFEIAHRPEGCVRSTARSCRCLRAVGKFKLTCARVHDRFSSLFRRSSLANSVDRPRICISKYFERGKLTSVLMCYLSFFRITAYVWLISVQLISARISPRYVVIIITCDNNLPKRKYLCFIGAASNVVK
jgi:hypothetical protein